MYSNGSIARASHVGTSECSPARLTQRAVIPRGTSRRMTRSRGDSLDVPTVQCAVFGACPTIFLTTRTADSMLSTDIGDSLSCALVP